MEIVSKIGTVYKKEADIYHFLSDFRNIGNFIPANQIAKWDAQEDQCRFDIIGIGDVEMRMIEKQPHKLVKLSGTSNTRNVDFTVWIQMKEVKESDTKVKITLRAELPAMLKMVAKKPIEKGLNKIIDNLDDLFRKVDKT